MSDKPAYRVKALSSSRDDQNRGGVLDVYGIIHNDRRVLFGHAVFSEVLANQICYELNLAAHQPEGE